MDQLTDLELYWTIRMLDNPAYEPAQRALRKFKAEASKRRQLKQEAENMILTSQSLSGLAGMKG